jgi:uncharacterized membrane protein
MSKGRIEAFSDGVLAIIITIMVLELRAPHGTTLEDLRPLFPSFVSYFLSFVFVGIYWSNHHHLFQAVETVKAGVLWANLHLLFWLSLVPLATDWVGENQLTSLPMALYGVVLLGAATGYYILVRVLMAHHGKRSKLSEAIGSDFKGKISLALYLLGIFLAFVTPLIAYGLYWAVALIWLIPDRRIERVLSR